ncbi:MAG: acyl-CoA desaturase [Anaerolineae bacterium]
MDAQVSVPVAPDSEMPSRAARGPAHSAYADLRRTIVGAGLLERRYGYYLVRSVSCYALLILALAIPIVLPPTWPLTILAAFALGFISIQIGMLGHDAGHLAVLRSSRANYAFGVLCWSLTLGVGFWYWRARHNAHHAHTNDADGDPEIRGSSLVAFTEEDARSRTGWQRVAVRYQAVVAPVLLLVFSALAVIAFRVESWLFARRSLTGGRRAVELGALTLNTLVWVAVLIWAPHQWRVIFLLSQAVAGVYLSLIVAPNHKGMPVWPAGSQPAFLERQVLSSRNVKPGPITDYVYGGLNYQIEHHLFPTMPRANYSRAREIVLPFCRAQGLDYEELPPIASYAAVWAELDRVGRFAGRDGEMTNNQVLE